MYMNPLTMLIGQVRDVMVWGRVFDWPQWMATVGVSGIVAWMGYAWFQKTRKGFADVL
jgi:lipopolysaccharide transport system permease protein